MRAYGASGVDAGGVALRPARRADWDEIERLLTGSRLPLAGAEAHLDGFVLGEREGRIVGCAAIERYGTAGLLRSVAVAPEARGTGLGRALVERCVDDARAAGLESLLLLTTTAERYFPRFGFRVVERASLPAALGASEELRGACPASAIAMRLELAPST